MKKVTFFYLLVFTSITVFAQYKGNVFEDVNGNGKKDKNENAIQNAVVSNGYQIVRTDKKGHFELPYWKKARFITIYPSGNFEVKQRYIPIDDRVAYNFTTHSIKKKKKITFLQISDTETYEPKEWLNNLKNYIRTEKPDFVMHTGDICYKAGMEWHAKTVNDSTLHVPIYYCLGNHDLVAGDYGEKFFEDHFGPAWYAFQKGNALYVITPMKSGDATPSYNQKIIGHWLKNLLAIYPKEMPKYFFNHNLLSDKQDFIFNISKKESIKLSEYNLKAWFFGHWHNNFVRKHKNGTKYYSTGPAPMGGIDHSISCFRVCNVDEKGDVKTHLRWTLVPKTVQIISPQDTIVISKNDKTLPISVNAYSSNSPIEKVEYKLFNRGQINWKKTGNFIGMKTMKAVTDWNWQAKEMLHDDIDQYDLVVKAYLKNGNILYQRKAFTTKKESYKNDNGFWGNLGGNKEHDAIVDKNWNGKLQQQWVTNLAGNSYMGSPLLYQEKVIAATYDVGEAENTYIVAMQTGNGNEIWRFKTENGIKNQMILANGKVIATDMLGITYALSAKNGKLLWKNDQNYKRMPAFISGIVSDGKIVYTGFGNTLCGIDIETGATIWKNSAWNGGEGTIPAMTIADNLLITSSNWRSLYAHNRYTGELVWQKSDEGLSSRDGTPVYKNGFLWLSQNNANGSGALHQLDIKTGKTKKLYPIGISTRSTAAPIIAESKAFVAGSESGIVAISTDNDDEKWRFLVQEALFCTPQYYSDKQATIEASPVLIGDYLVFGAMDGWLYSINANTGALVWKQNMGVPILGSVAVGNNSLYVTDFAGNLYRFNLN